MKKITFRPVKIASSFILFATAALIVFPFEMAFAAVAPSLGAAQSFAILGSSTVTNTGPTIINGDLGLSPGSAVVGFPPGIVVGAIHVADVLATQAQVANTTAYNQLASQACDATISTDLGGLTLVPGVYCFTSSAQLTGTLTLDAQGNSNAVWVFKIGSTLTTASSSSVLLINGAQSCNVFWQVGSSATIGTASTLIGNILALTSVTLTTGANLFGRAFAQNGAVTLDSNIVTASTCIPPVIPIPPTIGKTFDPLIIPAGQTSTLTLTLSNANSTAAALTTPFTDTLPNGVLIAGGGSSSCGGIVSTGTASVTLTGGSIPANSFCTISVLVTAANGGNYINTVPSGALTTSNGSNVGPAVATLSVNSPTITTPTISKAFNQPIVNTNVASTLTLTLNNTSVSPAIMTAPLTDTLPAGLVIAAGPVTNTCGGSLTAIVGSSTLTLTGGTIPANGSCIVTVLVKAPNAGTFINSLAAGALQTSNGNNQAPAVASLSVLPVILLPSISKSFSPSSIEQCEHSFLTITLFNPAAQTAFLTHPLIDRLPSQLDICDDVRNTCGGQVHVRNSTVTLSGASIPAQGSCTITLQVTSECEGTFTNTLPAGALQTTQGSNALSATATLTIFPECESSELNESISCSPFFE